MREHYRRGTRRADALLAFKERIRRINEQQRAFVKDRCDQTNCRRKVQLFRCRFCIFGRYTCQDHTYGTLGSYGLADVRCIRCHKNSTQWNSPAYILAAHRELYGC